MNKWLFLVGLCSSSLLANESIAQTSPPDALYNDARVIFHAIGAKVSARPLEGMDPSKAIEILEYTCLQFLEQNPSLSSELKSRFAQIQKRLSQAKTTYWACNDLVKQTHEPESVREIAQELAHNVSNIALNSAYCPLLFVGGHYFYNEAGSMIGHTVTYEVTRLCDGKLRFIINNTLKQENYHDISENRIRQLIYKDLEPIDLDVDFWRGLILVNYMNSVKGLKLMEGFYGYADAKLYKGSNKIAGRSYRCQETGICAWKSLSVWLHGQISPGDFKDKRNSYDERTYLRFKKLLFENMLMHFTPDNSAHILINNVPADLFLKAELTRKIQSIDLKILE